MDLKISNSNTSFMKQICIFITLYVQDVNIRDIPDMKTFAPNAVILSTNIHEKLYKFLLTNKYFGIRIKLVRIKK